jgi:hypothetical protein
MTAEVSDSAITEPKLDDAARAATERVDRAGKKRDKRAGGATEENKEFWETWAENKSTHAPEPARAKPAPAAAADEPAEEALATDASDDRSPRRGRDRGRGRDKKDDRGAKKDDRHAKADKKSDAKSDAKAKDDGEERGSRGKREAAAPAAEGSQARLFVSLGKKHGVSADDLRTLLAGPIGGDTGRIGSVSLRDSHAHVRVPEDLVEDIIAGVNGTSHHDQAVTVERARA